MCAKFHAFNPKCTIVFLAAPLNKFSTFCVNILCNDILSMHKTYIPGIFSVLLQLKDLISENRKTSK